MQNTPLYREHSMGKARRALPVGCLVSLLFAGLLALLAPGIGHATPTRQQAPRALVGEWEIDRVADWEQGAVNGLIITNNDGGELRLSGDLSLDGGPSNGVFLSDPFEADFPFNAAGAFWRADLPTGTDITLELRGRATPPGTDDTGSNAGWSAWYPLIAGDARSQADDGAFAMPYVREFPPGTNYLQLRATFDSSVERASAVLNEITIVYLNTTQGPPTSPALPRVPITAAPQTLTAAPALVPRAIWSGSKDAFRPNRIPPRGIIVHQIDVTDQLTDTLALLRSLATYQTDVLGWDGMAYHYLIDEDGTLYEGRRGGPTSAVSRLAGSDTAVHVALIANQQEEPASEAQQTLVDLLAWLGQAYDIPPVGQHEVLVGNSRVTRENIAGHNEIIPDAPGPGEPLNELLPDLRARADAATIRGRWYVAEGNVADYAQQLEFFNPTERPADVSINVLAPDSGEAVTATLNLAAGGRSNLLVDTLVEGFSEDVSPTDLAWIVEANEPIITNRTIGLPNDIDVRPVADHLSRVWYFAEGSTSESFETYLVLFNPQRNPTDVVISYMQGSGAQARQEATLPAGQRVAIRVNDVLPEENFGIQVIASQPIVAERTMRFGTGDEGMHSTPGVSRLSRQWFFAEGSTQEPFDMRLLLLNPNRQAATAAVTYMTPDGTSLTRRYAIPPTTRLSIDVNEVVPELGVATMIEADRPLAVERALYIAPLESDELAETRTFTSTEALLQAVPPLLGTVSFGATSPAYSWRFADGRVNDANQYLLLSNPSRGQARVTVEFLLSDGSSATETVVMPVGSRYTLPVSELFPEQALASAVVRSTQPIVAERSIFPIEGVGSGGGSTALGVPGD